MANTDQNITELPIKTSSEVLDEDYMLGIDLVEGYQVTTKDFADYAVNRAAISIGGKTQTTASAISEVRTTAGNAQPKESGKGLSANDFTNAYKSKLDGIAAGAEVNVQSDWNASSGDAAILHKPTTISGYGITDAYTKTQVDTSLAAKSDKSTTYTKTEVDDIVNVDEDTSEAANPIFIETDAAQYAKKTHLTLEPVQDLHGYDHPWPAGGGKNLLDYGNVHSSIIGVTATYNLYTGEYKVNFATGGQHQAVLSIANASSLAGKTVTFSYDSVSVSNSSRLSDWCIFLLTYVNGTNETIIANINSGTTKSVTVSLDSSITEIRVLFRMSQSHTSEVQSGDYVIWNKVQLELGSTATDYEPYSNICPITGLDEVEVRATGKNLLPLNFYTGMPYDPPVGQVLTLAVDTSVLQNGNVFSKTVSSWGSTGMVSDKLKPGTYKCNLAVSADPTANTRTSLYTLDENFKVSRTLGNQQTSWTWTDTITIEEGEAYIGLFVACNIAGTVTITNPQIELGSTATDYEPYTESVSSVDLPETVYGGTLDLETGKLVVDMGIVDLGTLNWVKETTVTDKWRFYTAFANHKKSTPGELSNMICSIYPTIIANSSWRGVFGISNNGLLNSICVCDMSYSDSTDFKTAMSGVQLCYELATPITYQLTPQQLALFKGTNVISTNAKTVQVTYRNGEFATTGNIVDAVEVAKQNAIGESESYTDARLATELAPILGNFATAETSPASASHDVGEYLLYNNRLFKVLAAISAGQQLTIGTNIGQTSVAAELARLNSLLT